MLETYELLVILLMASFIVLLFTGYPIAWTLAGVSFWFVVIAIYGGEYADLDAYLLTSWARFSVIVDRIWAQMQNSVLIALPMFVFMGLMLDRSGVADNGCSAACRAGLPSRCAASASCSRRAPASSAPRWCCSPPSRCR